MCNFDFVLFWLGIWCESLVWVIIGGGISECRHSSCSSYTRSYPSLFHAATSLLNQYEMACMADILHTRLHEIYEHAFHICVGWVGAVRYVSCVGHHQQRGNTTTGSALDGAVLDFTQILAYLVHNMSRSKLYLGFGHFGWRAFFLVNNLLAGLW